MKITSVGVRKLVTMEGPSHDPDDDLAVLSRQLLRADETIAALQSQLAAAREVIRLVQSTVVRTSNVKPPYTVTKQLECQTAWRETNKAVNAFLSSTKGDGR